MLRAGGDFSYSKSNFRQADAIAACSYEIALLESGVFDVELDRFTILPHAMFTRVERGADHRSADAHDGAFLMDLRCLDHEEEFVAQLGSLETGTLA